MVGCPISITLGYLKGVLPDGVAAAWVGAIARQAALLYIRRLSQLAAQQEREEEDEGGRDGMESIAILTQQGVIVACAVPSFVCNKQLEALCCLHQRHGMAIK